MRHATADAFRMALEQDPTFLAAQVFLYSATPGTESMHKVEEATKAGAGLPEAERTLLEWMNAGKHGDVKTDVEKATRLVQLAPKDPIAHIALAQDHFLARKLDQALARGLARRFGVSYPIVLVVFGLLCSLIPHAPRIPLPQRRCHHASRVWYVNRGGS